MPEEQTPATAPEAQPTEATPATEAPQPDPREEELARVKAELQQTRGGYISLQQKYDSVLQRANASTALLSEVAENMKILNEGQRALVKSTMGEEQAAQLDERLKTATEAKQRDQATARAMEFVEAQTSLFNDALSQFGVDPRSIQWPQNAASVLEWQQLARQSVAQAIGAARERYVKAVEAAGTKAKEAAKVEAEKIADKELARAGVGRIDNAKGSGTTFKQRLDSMNPTSPEFQELMKQAKRGELTKI